MNSSKKKRQKNFTLQTIMFDCETKFQSVHKRKDGPIVSMNNDQTIDVNGMGTELPNDVFKGPIPISLMEKENLYSTYFNHDSTLKPLVVHSEFKEIFRNMIEQADDRKLGTTVGKNARIDLSDPNAKKKYDLFSRILSTLSQTRVEPILKSSAPSSNLAAFVPKIFNQGSLGSCYANAISQMITIGRAVSYSQQYTQLNFDEVLDYVWQIRPSRAFIEYNCDRIQTEVIGDTLFTQGAYDWSAMESIVKFGAPPELIYDYAKLNTMNSKQFKNLSKKIQDDLLVEFYQKQMFAPDGYVYQRAKCEPDMGQLKWYTLSNPKLSLDSKNMTPFPLLQDLIRKFISCKFPLYLGMPVFRSWYQLPSNSNKNVPLKDQDELIGFHAVVITGYDTENIQIVNSWGQNSGDKGFFYLPWAYLEKHLSNCVIIALWSTVWNQSKRVKIYS